jgi:hypothetical protein
MLKTAFWGWLWVLVPHALSKIREAKVERFSQSRLDLG